MGLENRKVLTGKAKQLGMRIDWESVDFERGRLLGELWISDWMSVSEMERYLDQKLAETEPSPSS